MPNNTANALVLLIADKQDFVDRDLFVSKRHKFLYKIGAMLYDHIHLSITLERLG